MSPTASPTAATPLLLRPDRVLTGQGGECLTGTDVVVADGQIAAITPRAETSTESGATIVDLPGRTLLPGLIDAHVHLGSEGSRPRERADERLLLQMSENARRLVSAGVTTARDLGCRDFLDVLLRDAIESGQMVGPHLELATRPITPTGGHGWSFGGEADTADEIRYVARANMRAGATWLKVMATGGHMTPGGIPISSAQYPADLIAVAVEEAHARQCRVTAHAHGRAGIAQAVAAGVDMIEHCSFSSASGVLDFDPLDESLLTAMAASGTFVCPTVSGIVWNARELRGAEWFDTLLSRLARMRELGVSLVAGTDSGFVVLQTGFENRTDDYVRGLEVFAAAGWSNSEAIEAGTLLAARACGVEDRTGSITPGKQADLIAVWGDPTESLDNLRRLDLVMVSGRRVAQNGVDSAR